MQGWDATELHNPFEAAAVYSMAQTEGQTPGHAAEPSLRQAQTNSPEISEVEDGQDAEAVGQDGADVTNTDKDAGLPKWARPPEKLKVMPTVSWLSHFQ